MIKRDCLLITFGALAPLRAWTNQADVSLERVPKLRQLIESKFPQQTPRSRHTTIPFSRINVLIRFVRASHCSEFEKNEPPSIPTDSFLAEKGRPTVLHPNKERDQQKE